MKLAVLLLSALVSNANAASWSGFDGEYRALDTTFCDEILKVTHQQVGEMPEILVGKSVSGSKIKSLFAFPIGNWGVGDGFSYSYEVQNKAQGHYFTHLKLNSSRQVMTELRLRVNRETADEILAFDVYLQDEENNESLFCSYSRFNQDR